MFRHSYQKTFRQGTHKPWFRIPMDVTSTVTDCTSGHHTTVSTLSNCCNPSNHFRTEPPAACHCGSFYDRIPMYINVTLYAVSHYRQCHTIRSVTLYATPTVHRPLGNDMALNSVSVGTNGQHCNWHVTVALQQNCMKMMMRRGIETCSSFSYN
jgi:hypothetical protein